ncbi:hypothetical protein LX32DRAFT_242328 [Colletotrichum zoysiae]|uniref:Uncharacterized protein n=1 Tax=Colletotrichum zoysiae TaxID=1216348 RepID=A0AAD9H502_9PEZI|nr:hypothetical protein LX32DRAFT_242328 [Colletotrichum zoysiae]
MPSAAAVLTGYRPERPSPARFWHRSPLAEIMVLVSMPLNMPFRCGFSGESGRAPVPYKPSFSVYPARDCDTVLLDISGADGFCRYPNLSPPTPLLAKPRRPPSRSAEGDCWAGDRGCGSWFLCSAVSRNWTVIPFHPRGPSKLWPVSCRHIDGLFANTLIRDRGEL